MKSPNHNSLITALVDPAKAGKPKDARDIPLTAIRGLDDEKAALLEKSLGVATVGQFASDPRIAAIMTLASMAPGILARSGDMQATQGDQIAMSHLAWLLARPLPYCDVEEDRAGEVLKRVTE